MFSDENLARSINDLKSDLENYKYRYWKLIHEISVIKQYLKIETVIVPEHTEVHKIKEN